MKKGVIMLICFSLMIAGSAMAAPVWRTSPAGQEPTTYQEWTFDTAASPTAPETDLNPYGTASATVAATGDAHGPPGWSADWLGRSGVWHGEMTQIYLDIPNRDVQDLRKEIWVEVGYRGDATSYEIDGVTGPLEGWSVISDSWEWAGDGDWKILTVGFEIIPNPSQETLYLEFYNSGADVDYVVVDTICIPEPATMLLLGLGGFAVWRRKKQ